MGNTVRRPPLNLLLVVVLALVARAAVPVFVVYVRGEPLALEARDTASYRRPARSLIESWRFATEGEPEILRTPGYPCLLVPGLLIEHPRGTAIVLQIALGCATVALVWRLALIAWGDAAAATLASLLIALDPPSVVHAGKLLSETAFTALLAAFMVCWVSHLRCPSPARLLSAAICLAASIYVRPIAYYLPVVIAGLMPFVPSWPHTRRRDLRHAAVFLIVVYCLLAPWQIRNKLEADYWGLSGIADYNLYFCQSAAVEAAVTGESYRLVQQHLGCDFGSQYLHQHPEQRDWTQGQRLVWMRRQAVRTIRAHPFAYVRIHAAGVLRALLDPGGFELLRMFGRYPEQGGLLGDVLDRGIMAVLRQLITERPMAFWTNAALGVWLAVYLILAVATLGRRSTWRRAELVAIAGIVIYLALLSGGAQSEGRFRIPMMPAISVLAAAAGARAIAGIRRWMVPMAPHGRRTQHL